MDSCLSNHYLYDMFLSPTYSITSVNRIASANNGCFSNPCVNGGCAENEGSFVCHCFDGYSGEYCEIGKLNM